MENYTYFFLFLAEDLFNQVPQFHQLLRAVQKGKPVVIGSTGLGDFYQSAAFHNLQMMGDGRSGQIGLPGDLVDVQPFRVAVLGGNAQCFDDV